MKKNIVKKISVVLLLALMISCFAGCSEASKVNHNLTKKSGYFECERRVTVYNALHDQIILEIEGYLDISNNTEQELVVTCKVGPDEYKKNYIYLNDFVIYTVEDITGSHTDPYHYKMYFHKDILPDVEVKP